MIGLPEFRCGNVLSETRRAIVRWSKGSSRSAVQTSIIARNARPRRRPTHRDAEAHCLSASSSSSSSSSRSSSSSGSMFPPLPPPLRSSSSSSSSSSTGGIGPGVCSSNGDSDRVAERFGRPERQMRPAVRVQSLAHSSRASCNRAATGIIAGGAARYPLRPRPPARGRFDYLKPLDRNAIFSARRPAIRLDDVDLARSRLAARQSGRPVADHRAARRHGHRSVRASRRRPAHGSNATISRRRCAPRPDPRSARSTRFSPTAAAISTPARRACSRPATCRRSRRPASPSSRACSSA